MRTVRSTLDELWDKGKQRREIRPGDQYIHLKADGSYYLTTSEKYYPPSGERRWLGPSRVKWRRAKIVQARLAGKEEFHHFERTQHSWRIMGQTKRYPWLSLRDVTILQP